MNTAFATWRFGGVAFVAVPAAAGGGSVHIVDENGGNYGSWVAPEIFRHRQRTADPLATQPIGRAVVTVRPMRLADYPTGELAGTPD